MNLECVAVLHLKLSRAVSICNPQKCKFGSLAERVTHRIGSVCRLHTGAIKEESHGIQGLALPLAEGAHELLQLGCALDLEEDLIVVVRDLDVEVLGVSGSLLALVGGAAVLVLARHGDATGGFGSARGVWSA